MFWAACYGYLTDITSEKNRTKRFAYLDGLSPIARIIGMFLGALIKDNLGIIYNFIFGISIRYVFTIINDVLKTEVVDPWPFIVNRLLTNLHISNHTGYRSN